MPPILLSLMTFASASQFHVYLSWGQRLFNGLNGVLNVEVLVGAFNQEKVLVGAFSVIVKTGYGTDGSICGTIQIAWPGFYNNPASDLPSIHVSIIIINNILTTTSPSVTCYALDLDSDLNWTAHK